MAATLWIRILRISMRLLRGVAVSLALVLATTFGWQFSPASSSRASLFGDSIQRLQRTVRVLSQEIGTRNYLHYDNLNRAAEFIERSFKEQGYSVEEWSYEADGREFRNIVARRDAGKSEDYVLVGAHYDSCYIPGADDNASGIAGLLELARQLAVEKTGTNIMFVAFVNEEPPFFKTSDMGSRVFVQTARSKHVRIKAAVVMDMIGVYTDQWFSQRYLPLLGPFYPNTGNFIALIGNFPSKPIVDLVQKDFNERDRLRMVSILAPESIPGINFSDHASFWEAGVPAVLVTDTAYLRNKNYHQATDTIETLDFEKMGRLVEGLRRSIVKLAN